MRDFVAAVGLILAIEGLLCAAFPGAMRRGLENALRQEPSRLRAIGLILAVIGVFVVWAARRAGF